MSTRPHGPTGRESDRLLSLGPWSARLRDRAELADLAFHGSLVLRSIRFVIRDHDWRTAEVMDARLSSTPASGAVRLAGRSGYDGQAFVDWELRLRTDASGGALHVHAQARILRPFRRNRLGLVVLHPPQLAGCPLSVTHPDGSRDDTSFPTQIAPHQPALDVAQYEWEHAGVRSRLDFHGDVFEMEDQRNWTDASYKTYSTPLAAPFPVPLATGDTITQSLTLTSTPTTAGPEPRVAPEPDHPFEIRPLAPTPPLQLGASTAPDPEPGDRPGPQTILVELPADEPLWRAALDRARRDAAGGQLDVRIIASHPRQLDPVLHALDGTDIVRVGAFDRASHFSEPELLNALRDFSTGRGVELVAGTRAHFTELNRAIRRLDGWDGPLTFSITPQMHDRSMAQIIESLAMQRLVAQNAVLLADGRPLHIGPITLRPRFNAVATTPFHPSTAQDLSAGYGAEHVPDSTDPRQGEPWVPAWRQASIAALSVPGIASLSYFEAWGPRADFRALWTATGSCSRRC